MSARDAILKRVRAATTSLPSRSPLPDRDSTAICSSRLAPGSLEPETLLACFEQRWREASGIALRSPGEIAKFLAAEKARYGYVDPSVTGSLGPLGVETSDRFDRAQLDRYDFGITQAWIGIAETGTIALKDRITPNRLAALAPWTHVAVLRRADIVATLSDAFAMLDDDPSIVFVTGPSKTADIEGILIEGVHGPGRQVVAIID